MNNDLKTTDAATLREIANGLKADARALFATNKPEAMRLFKTFKTITAELHRRSRTAYLNN